MSALNGLRGLPSYAHTAEWGLTRHAALQFMVLPPPGPLHTAPSSCLQGRADAKLVMLRLPAIVL